MPFPAILLHTLVQSVLHLMPGTDIFYQHYIACEQALPLAGPQEVTMKGDAKAQGKYRKGVKVKVCFSSIAVHLPCHQFAQQICSAILHLSPPRTVQTLHSRYHTPAHAEKYVSDMAYTGELLIGNEQQHYKYNQKGYQGLLLPLQPACHQRVQDSYHLLQFLLLLPSVGQVSLQPL